MLSFGFFEIFRGGHSIEVIYFKEDLLTPTFEYYLFYITYKLHFYKIKDTHLT